MLAELWTLVHHAANFRKADGPALDCRPWYHNPAAAHNLELPEDFVRNVVPDGFILEHCCRCCAKTRHGMPQSGQALRNEVPLAWNAANFY
jgi:hypothetical protein